MPETDARRATIERDIVAWERRALKAERALRQRDEELRELAASFREKAQACNHKGADHYDTGHGQAWDEAAHALDSIFEEADGE